MDTWYVCARETTKCCLGLSHKICFCVLQHGKLDRCISCEKGRLKIEDETGENVICQGYYDEDMSARIPCTFKCKIMDAPRVTPIGDMPVWYVLAL